MKYKSGDIKKIFDIPRETLRFYENKGVVCPQRDEENNYRYFDYKDLNKIVALKFYRSLEFSLNDAIEMVDIGNEAQIERLMLQTEYLEKKAEYYMELSNYIKEYRNNYKEIMKLIDNPVIEEVDTAMFYFNQKHDKFKMDEKSLMATKVWLDCLPFVRIAVNISFKEDEKKCNMNFGYGVFSDNCRVKEQIKDYVTKTYHKSKCIHGIISYESEGLTYENLEKLIVFAEINGYTCESEFFCWLINEENLQNEKIRYLECFIPVK